VGLDMYLSRRVYVKNWDHMPESQRWSISVMHGGEPVDIAQVNVANITYIEEEVGYWRKANQIHKWFVENVQGGKDECQNSYVSRSHLETLLDVVERVLASCEMIEAQIYAGTHFDRGKETRLEEPGQVIADTSIAEALLPTESGFFFGGTDYDQWYVRDLEHTKTILEYALSLDDGSEFFYHASW